jgi:hypothetical protein
VYLFARTVQLLAAAARCLTAASLSHRGWRQPEEMSNKPNCWPGELAKDFFISECRWSLSNQWREQRRLIFACNSTGSALNAAAAPSESAPGNTSSYPVSGRSVATSVHGGDVSG